jgi:hypothetical protein
MQSHSEPYAFRTKRIGEPKSVWLGRVEPASTAFFSCPLSSAHSVGDIRVPLAFHGVSSLDRVTPLSAYMWQIQWTQQFRKVIVS